jgi:hypothetical protein
VVTGRLEGDDVSSHHEAKVRPDVRQVDLLRRRSLGLMDDSEEGSFGCRVPSPRVGLGRSLSALAPGRREVS